MDQRQSHRTALGVLAVCFMLSLFGRGIGESFTVFLLPVSQTFGWDRAEVVSIYSLLALCGGLAAPLLGRLFDRYGPHAVYSLGLFVLGTAFLTASFASRLWQFQTLVGLGVGFAIAAIGNVPNSILIGRWFGPRLPTAMSIVYSATGFGVLIMLPLAQLLIDEFGWRGAYRVFGTVALIALAPLALMRWRTLALGSPDVVRPSQPTQDGIAWTLGAAVRHHAFWALFATFFFTAVGMYAIAAQVVAYLIDAGFPPLTAASAWGFSGIALVVGMLSISQLDSLIGRRRSVLASYATSITGIILLWLLKTYPNVWLLGGFIVTFGSMIGSRGPLLTATAMKIFRGEHVGTIYGSITIGSGLGSAIGAWIGGLLHDWTNSYDALLIFALVSVILGALPFLTVRALRE